MLEHPVVSQYQTTCDLLNAAHWRQFLMLMLYLTNTKNTIILCSRSLDIWLRYEVYKVVHASMDIQFVKLTHIGEIVITINV